MSVISEDEVYQHSGPDLVITAPVEPSAVCPWTFVYRGLIGVAQILIWWSLAVATAGVAVALWLLIGPTVQRVMA